LALHLRRLEAEAMFIIRETVRRQFDAAFGGARRDEEKSRAKERIFSHRSTGHGARSRARSRNFTGVDQPCEVPELHLLSARKEPARLASEVIVELERRKLV
jgi:Phosphoadenosine phosphosulfate reductase family